MMLDHKQVSFTFKTIAVVDDNTEFCLMLKRFLETKSYDVTVFSSSSVFLHQTCALFDLTLLDLFMPDPDGVAVIRHLAQKNYAGAVLLMSGEDQGVLRAALELARAQNIENIASIRKPFSIDALASVVNLLLETKHIAEHSSSLWLPDLHDLKAGLESHQMRLYFQPKISLADNRLCGFEALLRWQHPEHGLIMPDRFISLAEQSMELMQILTDEVIQLAVVQLEEWQKQGNLVRVSINISMLNLVALDFPEKLENLIYKHNLLPEQLLLEITETALMSEVTSALDILLRLKMKGFGLSIDDFGTGYSSLSQLHRIPFNELKIDRSFVMTMQRSHESRTIVETCIHLAKRLGLQVVAEGVEEQDVLTQLLAMGCDVGQGYFWSRAVSAGEASLWLSQLKPHRLIQE